MFQDQKVFLMNQGVLFLSTAVESGPYLPFCFINNIALMPLAVILLNVLDCY